MTEEQAIKWLKDMLKHFDLPQEQYQTALEIAIKALEQESKTEPCEDCISRQAVKELFQEGDMMGAYIFLGIDDLPSVTPKEPKADILDKIIAEIESQIHEEYIPCTGGYVSRTIQADVVLNIIEKYRQEG